MDGDVAGSLVLLPHLEGSEQHCCLHVMEGDIGSGKLREPCGSSSLRQMVHVLTCCCWCASGVCWYVVGDEPVPSTTFV